MISGLTERFVIGFAALAAFLFSPRALSDAGESGFLDHGAWIEARGWVRHLSVMKLSPKSWNASLKQSVKNDSPNNFDACLRATNYQSQQVDRCASSALAESRQRLSKTGLIEREFIEKVKVQVSILKNSKSAISWSAWLKFSSVMVNAGYYQDARDFVQEARKAAVRDFGQEKWIFDRLSVFEKGLMQLSDDTISERSQEIRTQISEDTDVQSKFLMSKISELRSASNSFDEDIRTRVSPDEKLAELSRRKWIIGLDRSEIEAIKNNIINDQFTMDLVRRLNSLANEHKLNSKEWTAIVSVLAGISAKVQVFSRSDGLFVPLEIWLSKDFGSSEYLSIDDDQVLFAHQKLLEEFTARIEHVTSMSAQYLRFAEERTQLSLIRERLEGMNSPVGRLLENISLMEFREKAAVLRGLVRSCDLRIRSAQAKLTSLEYLQNTDKNSAGVLKSFRSEVELLKAQRKELISNLLFESVRIMPLTQARLGVLQTRITQLKKTLSDWKTLISGPGRLNLSGTQAGQFFLDADKFLDNLSGELNRVVDGRRRDSLLLADQFERIAREVSSFQGELDQFLNIESKSLRPQFLKFLSVMDLDLSKRERDLAFQEQLAQSEIRDRVRDELKNTEWRRERMNDIRRIRSESLEWRSGR